MIQRLLPALLVGVVTFGGAAPAVAQPGPSPEEIRRNTERYLAALQAKGQLV